MLTLSGMNHRKYHRIAVSLFVVLQGAACGVGDEGTGASDGSSAGDAGSAGTAGVAGSSSSAGSGGQGSQAGQAGSASTAGTAGTGTGGSGGAAGSGAESGAAGTGNGSCDGSAPGTLPHGKAMVSLDPTSGTASAAPNSTSALNNAIDDAGGGALIVIDDGSYSGNVVVDASGADENSPVVIRAQSRLGVTWTGGTWTIKGSFVRIEGIHFKGGAVVVVDQPSHRTRITRCRFSGLANAMTNYVRYLSGVEEHRLDHCTMEGGGGHQIHVKQPSRYIHFERNHFKSMAACGESAQSGTYIYLWDAHVDAVKPANMVIEHNYFDNVCANGETICMKGSDSWVRHNTFSNGNGTGRISARHGAGHRIEGNFMFDAVGMTISGARHRVFNNYLHGCRTGFDLHAGNVEPDHVPAGMFDSQPNDGELCDPQHRDKDDDGDGTVDEGCENPYEPVVDSVFANNTVITEGSSQVGFMIGSLRSTLSLNYDASDNWFVNNLTYSAGGAALLWAFEHASGNEFASNVFFGADSDSRAGLEEHDPQLTPTDGVFRPTPVSGYVVEEGEVLVGSGFGGLVVCDDLDGDVRGATNDIGCDQVSSSSSVAEPLTAQDVGPDAS